ncbi:TetR/AcrR family transcriptional regulator [Ramlibacter tataouinensis]|uniref:TetR/AcrR family transcriptional regulator n=1 Tax=Ramlibacter tataouinensis TaxID=94132 RepID=UPI0022F3F336|nr:TetR/AcrR family transcriptional regulator [Ramlibacter tataouinensis]WBY02750.1 TetR/AcrR family transcriptional regulator [Ramlibacter tataouinensis]
MAVKVVSKVEIPELVEKRQSQILRAAIELYGKQGYHVTTIREVALRANVSVGLIYQYVQDKEDVLFLALVEVLESYQREIPPALAGLTDPMERFCAAVRAYGHVIDQRIEATALVYRETKWLRAERRELLKQKEAQTNRLVSDCIGDCMAAGLFEDLDVDLFTYQIVMFCHAWALKAWHFQGRMTIDEYLDRGMKLMLGPVLTARGKRNFAQQAPAAPAAAARSGASGGSRVAARSAAGGKRTAAR